MRILELFPYDITFLKSELKEIIDKAYSTNFKSNKIIPLHELKKLNTDSNLNNQNENNNRKIFIMEEFYGETASFKDLALEFFSQLFNKAAIKNKTKENYLVLVATSGDTGSAVLNSFTKVNTPVLVLFPYNKISKAQELHMTTFKSNICKSLSIKGNFDDCQNIVKAIFSNKEFYNKMIKKYNVKLTSANSISWGRLLPQVVYSINSYLELVKVSQLFFIYFIYLLYFVYRLILLIFPSLIEY